MREKEIIKYRGFGRGHVVMAALTGAAVVAIYGAVTRYRVGHKVEHAKEAMARVPTALRQATVAARDAFHEALRKENGVA
jgi:hypothetical protein